MQNTSHDWHVITLLTHASEREQLSHLLTELESAGILEEEKSGQLFFKSYFAPQQSLAELQKLIQKNLPLYELQQTSICEAITCTLNPNEQGWKQYFQPFCIAKNIVIAPEWEKYQPQPGELVLTLNPGLAFGTGLHETTKLCAEAIAELVPEHKPKRFLDLGCGSGILALIARKLGAGEIWGIDIDPIAIDVCKENSELNSEKNLHWSVDLSDAVDKFDLVIANILLLPLLELKNTIVSKLNSGAYLVLSGITVDQADELQAAYETSGLKFISKQTKGEWASLILRNC